MTDDTGRMADDGCRMADDRCEATSGGCSEGESGDPTPEVSQGRIVGHDSDRVINDPTNDKIGILSHEETDAADRPCQDAWATGRIEFTCDTVLCGLRHVDKLNRSGQ